MQDKNNKSPKSLLKNILDTHSVYEKRELANHIDFTKDAIVELIDHPAFEDETFRDRFKCLVLFLENLQSVGEGFDDDELEEIINGGKKVISENYVEV